MPKSLSPEDVEAFREELCRVATRRFAERGDAGVTLRALAEEVGVSPMTPYRYFDGKDGILAAVRTAAFERFLGACEKAVEAAPGPREALLALGLAYLRFARGEPHSYRLMFELTQPDNARFPELVRQVKRAARLEVDTVRRAVDAGVIQGRPDELATLFWAGIHGLAALALAGALPAGSDLDVLATRMLDSLIRGNAGQS